MKVFITKYAFTLGIKKTEGAICKDTPAMFDAGNGIYYFKPYWHETKAEAIKHVDQMKVKKIASLEKQIKKIKEKTFS